MNDIVDVLWRVHNDPAGGHEAALQGTTISFEEGQQLQLDLLQRWLEAGHELGGWKIGMTSGANRNGMGDGIRPFGFILNAAHQLPWPAGRQRLHTPVSSPGQRCPRRSRHREQSRLPAVLRNRLR